MRLVKVLAVVAVLLAATDTMIFLTVTPASTALIISAMLLVFTIIMIPILSGIVWQLALQDKYFTMVQTGHIKFVVAGESWAKTLINIPGKVLVNGYIVDEHMVGDSERRKTFLEHQFGLYWVGIYPFRSIHSFPITKIRENQDITPKTKPEEWIDRDKKPTLITELRWKFPRPVLVPGVKFAGALRADILVLCKFEVVQPTVPIFIQKAHFIELLESYVRNAVINYCQGLDYQQFMLADKKDGGNMSQDMMAAINVHITNEIGVCVRGFGVSQYDSSDKETQRLMQAMETARLEGEAAVKRAEQLALSIVAEAKGHAEADRIRGAARIVDITELANELIAKGVDPNVAAQAAAAVGRAERFTRSDSKLTTLVDGTTGANIAVPVKPTGNRE
jgi:hypothetical protein